MSVPGRPHLRERAVPPAAGRPSTIEEIIAAWSDDPGVIHIESLAALPARFAEAEIHPLVAGRLAERGIGRLYRHQAEAIESIRGGAHTVIATGTASGKSLTYQVPVAEAVLADQRTTTLLLHPTKALSQDQLRSFRDLRLPELRLGVFDGDTPRDERARIRRAANVVLTNPDMLHIGILPAHAQWATFMHRLRFVVVDEMHTLRGIFGTHVGFILRRLRRVAAHYGADPTFIFSSATIGNPEGLAEALGGLPVSVIADDASGRGRRWVALRNPPLLETDGAVRRSALPVTTDTLVGLVTAGIPTIVFTRSRKATELVYRWSRERLPSDLADRIAPYRSGYLPAERRETERRLFAGELAGVVATSALELGIDVGGLDAAVLATFPGTISSFRQQAGRAGRRADDALVVLVAGEDALDQYFMAHPTELFTRPPEAAVVNPANPFVAQAHAGCAAYELPLVWDDREVLGDSMEEAANRLVQDGSLRLTDERLHWVRRPRPAWSVDIRAGGGRALTILCGEQVLGTVDEGRAAREAHLGAVYLHRGDAYLVVTRDDEVVRVERTAGDVYTEPHEQTSVDVLDLVESTLSGPVGISLGKVRVESRVVGFRRRLLRTRRVLADVALEPAGTTFETDAVLFTFPDEHLTRSDVSPSEGALHAAEHAAIGLLPLLAVCDRWDVGGLSTPWHPDTAMATIVIYEAFAGGAGISPVVFAAGSDHLRATRAAIEDCSCLSGCPACVVSPKCGNFNEPLDKEGAVRLLAGI